MKLRSLALLSLAQLLIAFSCSGQTGPTAPSVTLTWTQSATAGVTKNCIYRGTVAGVYTTPALFCSAAPITSYEDQLVTRGTSYHYAVTAVTGAIEGPYSTDVAVTVQSAPAAPTAIIVVVR